MKILPYLAVAAFVAGVAMLIVGYTYSGDSKASPDPVTYFTATPYTPTATPTGQPSPTPTPPPYNGALARFVIPEFKVDVPIEAIGIKPNNELDTPHDPHNVGWYDSELAGQNLGTKPGFGGNAVFSAHVNYYGLPEKTIPFNRLKDVASGDEIDVVMDNGATYRYAVRDKITYTLDEIKMGELIEAPTKPPGEEWITLITCGDDGPFVYLNGHDGPVEYLTRLVVTARRIDGGTSAASNPAATTAP